MYDCGNELHFDCGCDEEFASRPRQRYCGCGQPMGYRDQQCDACLDIALSEDLSAALDDHYQFEPLMIIKEFLVYAEGTGAYKAEALDGLRACAAAFADRGRGVSERHVRRLLDTGEMLAAWHEDRRQAAAAFHDEDCRCADCCCAYVG